jgi:hypothetical protein
VCRGAAGIFSVGMLCQHLCNGLGFAIIFGVLLGSAAAFHPIQLPASTSLSAGCASWTSQKLPMGSPLLTHIKPLSVLSSKTPDDDDDDDGWGDETTTSSGNNDIEDKTVELRRLQQERSERRAATTIDRARSSSSSSSSSEEPERDLFVPIFALVSLLALFGSYGYEMMRLYSRGELYLPF